MHIPDAVTQSKMKRAKFCLGTHEASSREIALIKPPMIIIVLARKTSARRVPMGIALKCTITPIGNKSYVFVAETL